MSSTLDRQQDLADRIGRVIARITLAHPIWAGAPIESAARVAACVAADFTLEAVSEFLDDPDTYELMEQIRTTVALMEEMSVEGWAP